MKKDIHSGHKCEGSHGNVEFLSGDAGYHMNLVIYPLSTRILLRISFCPWCGQDLVRRDPYESKDIVQV